MKYIVHPNVTLEEVAGQYLLIAYGSAQTELPYIQQINETGAFFWGLLEARKSYDEIVKSAVDEYELDREAIEPGLKAFLNGLSDRGYISPAVIVQ